MSTIEGMFDPKRRKLAEEYNYSKKKSNIVMTVLNILFWFVFLGFSIELKIHSFINTRIAIYEIMIFVYIFSFYLLYSLFSSTLDYFLEYKLNRKYKLSNQDKREWLIDELKSFILGIVFFYLAVRSYLYLLNNYPDSWWIYYTVLASIFTVLITFIFPTVLLPIFFKLESYPDSEMKERLLELIKKANVKIDDIYEINLSTKINAANAAVMGIGSSRKVVLGDNLNDKYSYDEIVTVLAHELGHQVHGDIFKNILIQPFMMLIISYIIYTFWPTITEWYGYSSFNSVYTIPLLLIFVSTLSWVLSPVQLLLSRIAEKKADFYSIKLTGKADSFVTALARLADESLSPLKVSLYRKIFKQSHPPIKERIEYILAKKNSLSDS